MTPKTKVVLREEVVNVPLRVQLSSAREVLDILLGDASKAHLCPNQ